MTLTRDGNGPGQIGNGPGPVRSARTGPGREQNFFKNDGPDRDQNICGPGGMGTENFEKCWTGPDRDQNFENRGTSGTNLGKYFIYFFYSCISDFT